MPKPSVLQIGPYPAWDQLDVGFDVKHLHKASDQTSFLAEQGHGVRAIATRGELGAESNMIAACPSLEVIRDNLSAYVAGTALLTPTF